MIIDYHTHHQRCGHAQGTLRDMIEMAIEKGVKQLGLSDHSPYFFEEGDDPTPGIAMPKSQFFHYVNEMLQLREEYKEKIDIRLGVESDYIPGWEQTYKEIYALFPFDYIIGSVHKFDKYHVYDPTRWHQEEVDPNHEYIRYFEHIQMSARSGLFDIIAHMDAIKALQGRFPHHKPSMDFSPILDETVQIIKDCNVAVEINTSGIRKCNEIFPSIPILERLVRLDVPITFGSDSHSPDEILHSWEHVQDVLKQLGVKELATFKKRKRRMIKI